MIDTSRGINWGAGAFLIIYQLILCIALPFYLYYYPPTLWLALFSGILFFLTGLSITGGYHRYFSHRTFKTHPLIETLLLFFGSMTAQGSALRWSFDHRLHHAHVDTDQDPYSIKKGFWYAHCLWLFEKPREIQTKIVPDLLKNPRVMFQHRYYKSLMCGSNFLVFLCTGWLFGDYVGALFMAVLARMCALHHFTWFINSLAHTWGDKPFSEEQSAVDNYLISLVTFGEGYHNYHHTYANDYRNGIRWYHFDPTKWMIWILSKLRLATDLKRMDAYTIKKRMIIERQNLLLKQVSDLWYVKKDELEKGIQSTANAILEQINEFRTLMESYQKTRQEMNANASLSKMRKEMRQLEKKIKTNWREWQKISRTILRLKPISLRRM